MVNRPVGTGPPEEPQRQAAGQLAGLLQPYADPHPDGSGRLIDVPAEVAAHVVDQLPADLARARLNLVRPPMVGLVALAAELGARLVGSVTRGLICFDGLQVPAAGARRMAAAIERSWPANSDLPSALSAATAEGWTSWSAQWPVWIGTGADLLGPLPDQVTVVGVIWD